jgi:tRNA-intron endonuclease
MKKIQATLIKTQITSNSSEAHTLFQKSNFGEKQNQKILYSMSEAFFLTQQNKMQIFDSKDNPLSENSLLKKFCRLDKNFLTKYPVFKDLTQKGYIVKTALKFGTEFRVYEKGKHSHKSHSKWLCYPVLENQSLKWQDFAAKNRVAHSSKKTLLIAIIDQENQISYYETNWTRA